MTIDLNADVGESYGRWRLGDDEALLEFVTSANVACGFHGGDPATLRRTCVVAAERGVRIGAQVSYRDLVGFGRRFIDVAPDDLTADVLYQIGALEAMARAAGTTVAYVKPHGALYHAVSMHRGQAEAVAAAIAAYDSSLPVLAAPGSLLLEAAAAAGLRTVMEAYADRAYTPDGTLVSRDDPAAVLDNPVAVAEQAVRLACEGQVVATDGTVIAVQAESLCVHGDSPGALANVRAVIKGLADAGVDLAAFTNQRI